MLDVPSMEGLGPIVELALQERDHRLVATGSIQSASLAVGGKDAEPHHLATLQSEPFLRGLKQRGANAKRLELRKHRDSLNATIAMADEHGPRFGDYSSVHIANDLTSQLCNEAHGLWRLEKGTFTPLARLGARRDKETRFCLVVVKRTLVASRVNRSSIFCSGKAQQRGVHGA